MDFDEDLDMKDFFSTRLTKCETGDVTENWSSETDDIFNTFFPMDFLHNLNGHQDDLSNLDDFPEHVKIEQEDYKVTVPLLPETFLSEKSGLFSSNSSDSGLSSDNLEVEMNPPYEPLSPASSDTSTNKCSKEAKLTPPSNEFKSKVIVQQVPQVMNITNTGKVNPTILNPPNSQCYQQRTALNAAPGNEVKIVKLSPQMFASSNKKPVTIQVKNSNSGARIQAKPGTLFLNKVNFNEIKKIVRVQNSNPRSVLIPVSFQDVKKLKAFKIINTATHASTAKLNKSAECNNYVREKEIEKQTIFQAMDTHKDVVACTENSSDSESIIIEEDYDNEEYVHDPEIPYPKLVLTTEEKRLLNKEGINLPAHYPLTKHEERELKRIRRKIRNKISAQDSRKRKKEYVDGLEERVKQCTEENQTLIKRIKQLQNQNQNLMSQMKKLQSLLAKGTNKTTQPTTCLMVLLLSLALVAAPNLKLGQNSKESDLEEVVQETILQNRRSLLFNNKDQNIDIFDEELNMSDIASALETNNECEINNYASSSWGEPKCKQMKLINSDFINDVDDENWYLRNKNQVKTISTNEIYFLKNNEENLQSSGFNINIHNKQNKDGGKQTWLNPNVFKMVSHNFNDLNELNIDKFVSLNHAEISEAKTVDPGSRRYANPLNVNRNSSKMRQDKKY